MTMLQILSKNRDLKAQLEEAEHMLTEIDIESMPFFAIGFERGEKKGEEKGREAGEARIVRRLLSRLGTAEVSDLLDLSVEDLKRMAAGGNGDLVRDKH